MDSSTAAGARCPELALPAGGRVHYRIDRTVGDRISEMFPTWSAWSAPTAPYWAARSGIWLARRGDPPVPGHRHRYAHG